MSDYIKAEISLDEVTHGMAYEFLDILRDIRDRMPECPVEEPAIEAPGLILTTEIAKLRAEVNRLTRERDLNAQGMDVEADECARLHTEIDRLTRERDRAVFGMDYIREIHGLEDWKDQHERRIEAALAPPHGAAAPRSDSRRGAR